MRKSSGGGRNTILSAFSLLERRFGSIDAIWDKGASIVTIEKDEFLTKRELGKLFRHEAVAVVVKEFYPRGLREKVVAKILDAKNRNMLENWSVSHAERGQEESDVDTLGVPHNVAVAKNQADKYFKDSLQQIRNWRMLDNDNDNDNNNGNDNEKEFKLSIGPMDKLRLEMDEIWPDGCMLSKHDKSGLPFLPGIPRVMNPLSKYDPNRWTRGFAHVDELAIMKDNQGLYSANIYLQNALSGGELLIWPITFKDRWNFYRNAMTLSMCLVQDPQAQTYLREKLPPPLTIRPDPGDLVLLCTQRPHAVRGPIVGSVPRISMQGFIQYQDGKPLTLEV